MVCGAGFAQAQQRVAVRAMLGTNNENPPVSSGAHGEALVTVNRDSGEITYEARASDVIPRLEQGIRGFDARRLRLPAAQPTSTFTPR